MKTLDMTDELIAGHRYLTTSLCNHGLRDCITALETIARPLPGAWLRVSQVIKEMLVKED